MSNIIVFHSVLGIRRGIIDFSEMLRENGHNVFTVDLYDGRSFDDMQEAIDYFLKIGIPELMERTIKYTHELPSDAIYVGFSNGGASALLLAGTKQGAKGCVLCHAALPISELGMEKWPPQVPVDVHYAKTDLWKEEEAITKLRVDIERSGAPFNYYEYPIEGHLFTDVELPEYNKRSSDLLYERTLNFIIDASK